MLKPLSTTFDENVVSEVHKIVVHESEVCFVVADVVLLNLMRSF